MNVLPARVTRTPTATELAVEGVGMLRAAPELPGATGAASGDQVLASFRPQHVQVVEPGGRTEADLAWLAGTVKSSEFLGEMVRYHVSVGGHTMIADQAHEAGRPPITRESPVSLGIHPRHVRLLEPND